ncbi:LacI family DNA-binding transcriptional regulator [Salmonella enterica]|nr:LacI family DNA-binding transcriptional regulator [Salmonella enterica]
MATIKDVAGLAGGATATVSRVINQTAWVEPVTRERVEKAMRELNYHRNAAAIALAKRSGDMLGLLTGNLADPFFARLARGVEEVSRQEQFRLMVCSGGHDEGMEKSGLDFLINQGCEAIVVHASRLSEKELLRYAAHFPAMVADTTLFEHIQHLLWTTIPSFLLAAVVYLIAGHSNMLGEVATPQRVTDIVNALESLYHFNIILILPPVIVLWGAVRKKPVIPLMLSACVLALILGVVMQGISIKWSAPEPVDKSAL